ncbi:MAG TPA: hypothetical protein VFJ91_02290 [Gaiellaceae bacterium]|nr:hypothetical protein [Gaiellaceae bacterium]
MRTHWLWGPAAALLYAAVVAGVLLFRAGSVPAACAGGVPRTVDVRFLVVGAATDTTTQAWTSSLRQLGVPFTRVEPGALLRTPLRAGSGAGLYLADVVVSPRRLPVAGERRLAAYERAFGIRRIVARQDVPQPGLDVPPGEVPLDGRVAQLTAAGKALFPYLRGPVPIDSATGRIGTASGAATPLLEVEGGVLAARLQRPDGVEEISLTTETGPDLLHQLLLAPGLVSWAAHGLLTASWRPFLTIQIDDILLPSFVWIPRVHSSGYRSGVLNPTNFGDYIIRMTPADVRYAAAWERREGFTLDLGVNGYALGGDCGPLVRAVIGARNDFRWFNHTYQHLNLDHVSTAVAAEQIARNVAWAKSRKVPLRPWELVTGEHSGLHNPALPAALEETGIRVFGSDASLQPLPYRLGPATALPRHPMNVFQDAATRAQELGEFNWREYFHCSAGCIPAPFDWRQFRRYESTRLLRLMLSNDPRPSYAHESNLAQDRILLDVLSATLARFRALVRTPVANPPMTEELQALERRLRWRRAVADGTVVAVRVGDRLVLRSSASLAAPVLGDGRQRWLSLSPGKTRTVKP